MSKHRGDNPVGFPADMWANPDVRDAGSAYWDGVVDLVEDGKLSESARERMARATRTLIQGVVSAVAVGALPVAWDVLQDNPTDIRGAVTAFGTAAMAAVVAYFHRKR